MPAEARKLQALYIAKSLSQLNERIDVKVDKTTAVKAYCNTAAKMLKEAKVSMGKKDEERAYVLYMKFASLVQAIRKDERYLKGDKQFFNNIMGASNAIGAVGSAETLAKSLTERYSELKEAEEFKAKLDQREKEEEESKNQSKDDAVVNGVNGNANEVEQEKVVGEDGSITPDELYRLIQDDSKLVLVLDARTTEEHQESHIVCRKCANIPSSAIKPGCTVAVIEKGLSMTAKILFEERDAVDYIVMMDWDSSLGDLTQHSTLGSLKDAIYKWDSTVTLKREPVVLDGGYERFVLKYPMYTTNPKVEKPERGTSINKYASLDHFDYPTSLDDEEEPPPPPKPKPAPAPSPQQGQQNGPITAAVAAGAAVVAGSGAWTGAGAGKPMPTINRALKPGAAKPASQIPSPTENIPRAAPRPVASNVAPSSSNVPVVPAAGPHAKTVSGLGDAKPAAGAATFTAARPSIPHRASKPESNIAAPQDADLAPPSYEDVQEKDQEDEDQERILQEHKNKENAARLELERMRHGKAKAENEQLRKEKEDVEKRLEEKIAALQTLQKQLQEQQVKQEEEKKLAEERANAEEDRKKAEDAGAEVASESTAAAGSQDTSKPQASTSAGPAKASPSKDATKPTTQQPQPKTQQPKGQSPQHQQKPKSASATSRKTPLPPGWKKKLDPRSGKYFYVDHNVGRTQWEPPPPMAGVESRAGGTGGATGARTARSIDSSPKVSPQHTVKPDSPAHKPAGGVGQSGDSITSTKMRLKSSSDAEFSSKPGLKRSFSSPNIAKMVMDEEITPTPARAPAPTKPKFDRTTKPSERLTNIQQQVRPVTISRMRNLAPVYGSMGRSRTGLKNLGNTCFMNSVVQCLSATTLLSQYFISDNYLRHVNRQNPLGRGGEVVEEFAVVIKALWSGQYRSISPRDLRDTVYKYVPEFRKRIGQHHDSQEFLLFLMDGLHEDINQVTKREYVEEPDYAKMADTQAATIAWTNHKRFNQSIIVELFQGQFKSTIRCLTCQHISVKFDAFTFLTLPIPSSGRVQLTECLNSFSKPEKMTGDDAVHCTRCRTKRNHVKTIHLWKVPPVLLICLKRFYHEGMWRQKLQTMVEYPLMSMDMSGFVEGPKPRRQYDLYAVSNHTGTLDGGHYTAYCKNAYDKRWYKYDDHEVYDVSAGNIKSSAAYILFYTSVQFPEV